MQRENVVWHDFVMYDHTIVFDAVIKSRLNFEYIRLNYFNFKTINMANLHVQPKRKNTLWIWILIIIILIAAAGIYYYENYYKKGVNPGSENVNFELPATQPNLAGVLIKNT